RHVSRGHALRLVVRGAHAEACILHSGHLAEGRRLRTPVEKVSKRGRRVPGRNLLPRPDHRQLLGMRIRKRAEENRRDHAEHRRRGANPEDEHEENGRAEARVAPKKTNAEACVGEPSTKRGSHHSYLKATAGETRMARRAGRREAKTPARPSTP